MAELSSTMQEHGTGNNGDRSAEGVQWERFLPRMVLRVLLVEADHSTRQIIAALLRKCSYTVIAVPDGLKAWELLKKNASELDLIITEVDLPAISGFSLLSLIMEHEICKNIPVIMMSSHDSVSMVLKCMLKGAADFLIKPIRRNELGNLWQHVWRRHASSTPAPITTFSPKNLETASEDNSASNKSSGSVASSKENNEYSERLSEAQDVPQLKRSKQQKIDLKYEKFTRFESESTKMDNETRDNAGCDKTFESADLRLQQDHGCADTEIEVEILKSDLGIGDSNISSELHGCSDEGVKPIKGAIDLIATFGNLPKHPDENCSFNGGNTTMFYGVTQLELSLRSDFPGSSCKQASEATEESQRLNHSNTSAFSWYSNSKLVHPLFRTPSITSAEVNNPSWDSHESHKLSRTTSGNCCQYGGSNKNLENMIGTVIDQYGQVKPKLSNSQCGMLPVSGVVSDLKSKGHGNVFTSVFYATSGTHPVWSPKPVCQNESSPFPTSTSSQSNPESHNSDQYHEYSNDATCLNQNVKEDTDLDQARRDSPAADQSAGNSLCHDASYHVNSSAYGSMDSGNDGHATSAIVSKNNPEVFSDSVCHNYDGSRGTESHHTSQREAALTKFRLKRKERCFEKKVRYQSRKRLAEQRPRVKGQFVRQVHNDHPVADAGGDS
ncbi:two-component response regulator-like APRR3 isoform X2 [Vigna angularis]|uniref:two-component response regulator-like APRR3 isoform X2 n=1 Tax=Phaseolus angularis TaxID=3914 RepID=UPI000809DF93|nr:two-component response regulator-like APRR3 isoform X2 [Vigna angularis]